MITKEQAIEIVQKFNFFQGSRAGRELWFSKQEDIQDQDVKLFSDACIELLTYLHATVDPQKAVLGLQEKCWYLFDVPGFYDIVEYSIDRAEYYKGELVKVYASNNRNSTIIANSDDPLLFFDYAEARDALEKLIADRRIN